MSKTQPGSSGIVTAGLLVIGDEVVSDVEAEIVAALDALRARYTYVLTTGGIGPTHDDITADAVAKAFGVAIDYDPRAVAIMKERFDAMGTEMNAARMRM